MIEGLRARLAGVHRSTLVAALVVIYVLGSGLVWAMATPRSGASDEPAHVAYAAAVVRGDLGELAPVVVRPSRTSPLAGPFIYAEQTPVPWSYLPVVTVPEWAATDHVDVCFAFQPYVTADCDRNVFPVTAQQYWTFPHIMFSDADTPIAIPTTVQKYPPLYYSVVGLPSLVLSGDTAVYGMRAVSAVLVAGLVAMGLTVASPRRRSWLALGTFVAFTPTAAHLGGAINPSAMEIAASLGLGIGLFGLVGNEKRNQFVVTGLVLGLIFALAWARPLSFMTLAAVVAAAVLINGKELLEWLRNRWVRIAIAVGGGLAVVSAYLFETLVRDPVEHIVQLGAAGWQFQRQLGLGSNLTVVVKRIGGWGRDLVGLFGWSDHMPPISVVVVWLGLASMIFVLALVVGNHRQRIALGLVGVGSLLLAPLFVIQFVFGGPIGFSARYHLPLVVLLPIAAATIFSTSSSATYRSIATTRSTARVDVHRADLWTLLRWGAIMTLVGMLLSVAGSLYRYRIGGVAGLVDLWSLVFGPDKNWIPPAGAIGVGAIGLILMIGAVVAVFRLTRAIEPAVELL